MKTLLTLSLALISLTAHADDEARVRALIKKRVGIARELGDVRLDLTLSDLPACDLAGKTYFARFQVRKFKKGYDAAKKDLRLVPAWETVKTYYVAQAMISQLSDAELNNEIRDADRCAP